MPWSIFCLKNCLISVFLASFWSVSDLDTVAAGAAIVDAQVDKFESVKNKSKKDIIFMDRISTHRR